MAELGWGLPDEALYKNTSTFTKEVWNYLHSEADKEKPCD
jgi:hypothetical protein